RAWTVLPMAEVVLQASFRSLRRFNAVFVEIYPRSPTLHHRASATAGVLKAMGYKPGELPLGQSGWGRGSLHIGREIPSQPLLSSGSGVVRSLSTATTTRSSRLVSTAEHRRLAPMELPQTGGCH